MSVVNSTPQLLNNGYQVLPILSTGSPFKDHRGYNDAETEYTELDANEWCRNSKYDGAGVALICGKNDVFALDFDIDDVNVAKSLRKYIKKKYPNIPTRHCNAPRFAIIFKAVGDLLKCTHGYSNTYKLESNKFNQIELIGNRLITLYGFHRISNKPYKWSRGLSPFKIPVEDLPTLNKEDVSNIFDELHHREIPNSKLVSHSTFSRVHEEVTMENVQITRVYTEAELETILENANGDQREGWIKVGMALHTHYNGAKKGLVRWDKWSSNFDKYKGIDDCRYNWNRFKVGGGVTLSTIEKGITRTKRLEKNESGVNALTFDDMFDEDLDDDEMIEIMNTDVVDITNNNTMGIISREGTSNIMDARSFKAICNSLNVVQHVKDGRSKSGETIEKIVPLHDVWRNYRKRLRVIHASYVPTNNIIATRGYMNNNKPIKVFNTYRRPRVRISADTNLLSAFKTHIKHLFPTEVPVIGEPTNYELAMNWFAQITQNPSKRYRTALHSICTSEGMGRGWLVQVLDKLYGTHNVTTVNNMDQVLNDRKNGFLHESVLAVLNETSVQGVEKYAVSDKLKTMLSDPKQSIDIKYGNQSFGQIVYTRFFSQSNKVDGLMFTRDDTRFIVCMNHGIPKSPQYYEKLYELIEDDENGRPLHPDFMNQVYTYLFNLKVNTAWLQSAPFTADKRRVIQVNESETEAAFFELHNIIGDMLFSERTMDNFIAKFFAENYHNSDSLTHPQPNGKQLEHLVKEHLSEPKPIRIGNNTHVVRSFGSPDISKLNESDIKKSMVQCNNKSKQYFIKTGDKYE